jgi:hypothetical protein
MAEQAQKRMKVASARCCYRATRDIPSRYRKAHTRSRNIRLSRAYHSCAFSHYICLNVNFTERERERKPNIYRDYSNYLPRCSRRSSYNGHFSSFHKNLYSRRRIESSAQIGIENSLESQKSDDNLGAVEEVECKWLTGRHNVVSTESP